VLLGLSYSLMRLYVLICNSCIINSLMTTIFVGSCRVVKLAFHGAGTDTDILADFRARIIHEPDTH